MLIGSALGAVAGFFGRAVDAVIMRLADLVFAFPGIILALAVTAALGASLRNAVLAVIVVSWPSYARLARALGAGRPFFGVRDLGPPPRQLGLAHDLGGAPAQYRRSVLCWPPWT